MKVIITRFSSELDVSIADNTVLQIISSPEDALPLPPAVSVSQPMMLDKSGLRQALEEDL